MAIRLRELSGPATPAGGPAAPAGEPWAPPPAGLSLGGEEVHVWRVALDAARRHDERLWSVLGDNERATADEFCFPGDRDRFIAGRGSLRHLLGRYLQTDPRGLRFEHGPYGKPRLAAAGAGHPLCFNLSHSGDVVLIAVARGSEVGVDVQEIRTDLSFREIAARFVSLREATALRRLAPTLQLEAFCRTRKEAYLKARGRGLSFPLDRAEVSLAPDAPIERSRRHG